MKSPRKILLVDDHPIVFEGLRMIVKKHPDLALMGCCPTYEAACVFLRKHTPDLILMDICMKGTNGLVATRQLAETRPDLPILILTCSDERISALAAATVGAKGLIMKDQPEDEIVNAIRTVLGGGTYQSPQMRTRARRIPSPPDKSAPQRPDAQLSKREQEILGYLAEGASTARISLELGVSLKTIETHRLNIRNKLGVDSQTDLVRWAIYRRDKGLANPAPLATAPTPNLKG